MKENQVTVGMKKRDLDIEELEKEIRRQFSQITWASARLSGTKLLIDIKENDAIIISPEKKETQGTDLVAEYGGRVVSMIVRSGVPKVAIGDEVEAGCVLVEGKVPIYNEDATVREYYYVDADADIIIEHSMEFNDSLPFDYVRKEYTGREKTRYFLRFGGKEWKMPEDSPFLVYDSLIRESRPLLFEKLSIPIYTGSYTYREYVNVEHRYTDEEAKVLLNEKIMTFIANLQEKGVQIIEKDVKIGVDGQSWILYGDFLVQESVGKSADTEKVETGTDTPGESDTDE